MQILQRVLSTATLAVIGSCGLFGAQLSFSHTTASAVGPFTDNFTLQDFDPALGTLTGITVDLADTTTGEVDIFNATGAPQNFTNATSSVPLSLTAPAGLTLATTAVAGPISGVVIPGFSAFTGLTASSDPSVVIPTADFGMFEGSGSSSASFSLAAGTGSFSGNSIPGVLFGGSATAGGITTITYTFAAPDITGTTPEPATMVLLGSALLGLGMIRKKTVTK